MNTALFQNLNETIEAARRQFDEVVEELVQQAGGLDAVYLAEDQPPTGRGSFRRMVIWFHPIGGIRAHCVVTQRLQASHDPDIAATFETVGEWHDVPSAPASCMCPEKVVVPPRKQQA